MTKWTAIYTLCIGERPHLKTGEKKNLKSVIEIGEITLHLLLCYLNDLYGSLVLFVQHKQETKGLSGPISLSFIVGDPCSDLRGDQFTGLQVAS